MFFFRASSGSLEKVKHVSCCLEGHLDESLRRAARFWWWWGHLGNTSKKVGKSISTYQQHIFDNIWYTVFIGWCVYTQAVERGWHQLFLCGDSLMSCFHHPDPKGFSSGNPEIFCGARGCLSFPSMLSYASIAIQAPLKLCVSWNRTHNIYIYIYMYSIQYTHFIYIYHVYRCFRSPANHLSLVVYLCHLRDVTFGSLGKFLVFLEWGILPKPFDSA